MAASLPTSASIRGVRRFRPSGHGRRALDASPAALARAVADAALGLGFSKVGFAPATRLTEGGARLRAFLDSGYHGSMDYLGQDPRDDPRALLAEARSVVVVALTYGFSNTTRGSLVPAGQIARYARGRDYHQVLKEKLAELGTSVADLVGRPVLGRPCADTAPILERALAAEAGVGFIGKSTLLIAPGLGTGVVLGELILDVELKPTPTAQPGCGSCRACLDACPTGAFVDAHVLDARRCIAYLTIEHSGSIEPELRAAIGTRVFGCDVCQEVCPFNHGAVPVPGAAELLPQPPRETVDLVALLNLTSSGYRRLARRSALRRASRRTLQRNAAIALGNSRDPSAAPALCGALGSHPSALVREHVAWALGELGPLGGSLAVVELSRARTRDPSRSVRSEAELALQRLGVEPAESQKGAEP